MGVNCDNRLAKYTFCISVSYFLLSIKYSILYIVLIILFMVFYHQYSSFLQITVISVLMFIVVDMRTCTLYIEFRQTTENQTKNNPVLRATSPGSESTIYDIKAESKGQNIFFSKCIVICYHVTKCWELFCCLKSDVHHIHVMWSAVLRLSNESTALTSLFIRRSNCYWYMLELLA